MREEQSAAQEDMWPVSCQTLEAREQRIVDAPSAELVHQLVIVYSELLSVRRNLASHIPRSDYLRVRISFRCRLDSRRDLLGCRPDSKFERTRARKAGTDAYATDVDANLSAIASTAACGSLGTPDIVSVRKELW